MNTGETSILMIYKGQPDLIWVNLNDTDEAKEAYLKRLQEKGIDGLDASNFVIADFSEHFLAEHGGSLLNYDRGVGFRPPGAIPNL